METKVKVRVVIVYPNSENITHWQTDKNTMLSCQNVSTFKKMLYCLFLFRLLNVRPGNASKFFQNLDNILSLLYISAIAFGRWSGSCYTQISVDHHFTLLDQWDRWDFSILKRYAKDSRLNVIPPGSFSLSLPLPPPLLSFFSFFPNSCANEPVRRLLAIMFNFITKPLT